MTPADQGRLIRNTMRLSVLVALGAVLFGAGLRILVEITPSAEYDALEVPVPQVPLGGSLPFRMVGESRESCLDARTARFLVYRDGYRVPLTGEAMPNEPLLQNALRRADKAAQFDPNAPSKRVLAFTAIPVPRSYVRIGKARFGEQIDLAACGWLHGLLPVHPDLRLSNEIEIVAAAPAKD